LNNRRNVLRRRALKNAILSIVIILVAVLGGGLLVFASGTSPLAAYATIFSSTFGNPQSLVYTLSQSAPLIIVSLGLILAFRSSFWNGGGEGQMLFGGMMAVISTYLARGISFPPAAVLIGFISAFVGGGAWAALSGFLKVRYKVDDIVSTLLLAQVAGLTVAYLVRVPFSAPGTGASILSSLSVPDAAVLPAIGGLNSAFIVSVAFAVIVYLVMTRTKFGFRIKVLGSNKETAIAYFGRRQSNWLFVLAAFLSGGLIGMGGMMMVSAFTKNIITGGTSGAYAAGGFTNSFGFIGIAIVFLAGLDAVLTIPASLFFVSLVLGGIGLLVILQISGPLTITISGIAILLTSARLPIIERVNRLRRGKRSVQ